MLNKHLLIHGILVAALIHDMKVFRRHKTKFDHLLDSHVQTMGNLALATQRVNYLVHLMEEHEVPVTEFDLIALTHLI